MSDRLDWDAYFLNMARAASTRSTCDRAHVGCVLVKEKQIVSTGYNGSISGTPHCDDVGHLIVSDSCLRTIHAELNSLASAARRGAETSGSTCYTTHFPCWPCFRALVQAGVSRIVYSEFKSNRMTPEIYAMIASAPIELCDNEGKLFSETVKVVDGAVVSN